MEHDLLEKFAPERLELDEAVAEESAPSKDFLDAIERARREIEESFRKSFAKDDELGPKVRVKVDMEAHC